MPFSLTPTPPPKTDLKAPVHPSVLVVIPPHHPESTAPTPLPALETADRKSPRSPLRRALTEAQLPNAKSFSNFDFAHCPQFNPAPLVQLAEDTAWL